MNRQAIDIIGKTTIHPVLFYTGKISGYITWVIFILKVAGVEKISRNPMYLGFNLLTIASMIYTLNLWIILLGIYSMTIYHLIILREEIFLQNRFGISFPDYKKKTGRYL